MKKINFLTAAAVIFYVVLFTALFWVWQGQSAHGSREYLVQINRIMRDMEEAGAFSMPDRTGEIRAVSFLPAAETGDVTKVSDFLRSRNNCGMQIEPLIIEENLHGMVRFDYQSRPDGKKLLLLAEGALLLSGLFVLTILVYIRTAVLEPFHRLSEMPFELAKGHLRVEIGESRNRFFGRFTWGLSMLRDELAASAKRNLELEKEKKLLLLSISHDIKTPLNTIKLYARALRENLYGTKEKQEHAVMQIERLSDEIEAFVKRIVQASREEIVPIDVENSEFYLKELVGMIDQYYGHKCRLLMTRLVIGEYEDKLLRGDLDRAFEAVENIMENAFKYGDGKEIEIGFYEEDDCQLIRIKNTGQPTKGEEIPKLFDSFYRAGNAGAKAGNGLGLYICREIMHRMGGEIFATAEEDGMCFHLVFPAVSAAPYKIPAKPRGTS